MIVKIILNIPIHTLKFFHKQFSEIGLKNMLTTQSE